MFEVKTMKVDNRMNKYNFRCPVTRIELQKLKQAKQLNESGNLSNPFLVKNGIDLLIDGHYETLMVTMRHHKQIQAVDLFLGQGDERIARHRIYALVVLLWALQITKRFLVALACMTNRNQSTSGKNYNQFQLKRMRCPGITFLDLGDLGTTARKLKKC